MGCGVKEKINTKVVKLLLLPTVHWQYSGLISNAQQD